MTIHRNRDAERFDGRGITRPSGGNFITQDSSDDGLDRRVLRRFPFLVIVAAMTACSSSSSPPTTVGGKPGADATVDATPAITFTPSNLTVTAGETVKFAFGSVPHNVYFDASPAGAPADIAGSNSDKSVNRTFNALGTFSYECHIHPGMRGTITVVAEQ